MRGDGSRAPEDAAPSLSDRSRPGDSSLRALSRSRGRLVLTPAGARGERGVGGAHLPLAERSRKRRSAVCRRRPRRSTRFGPGGALPTPERGVPLPGGSLRRLPVEAGNGVVGLGEGRARSRWPIGIRSRNLEVLANAVRGSRVIGRGNLVPPLDWAMPARPLPAGGRAPSGPAGQPRPLRRQPQSGPALSHFQDVSKRALPRLGRGAKGKEKPRLSGAFLGADDGIRTHDLLHGKAVSRGDSNRQEATNGLAPPFRVGSQRLELPRTDTQG